MTGAASSPSGGAASLRVRLALLVAALSLLLTTSLGGYLWHALERASLDALDRELATSADLLVGLLHLERDGGIELEGHVERTLQLPYRIEAADGGVIGAPDFPWPAAGDAGFSTARVGGHPYRILTRRHVVAHHGRRAEVVLRIAVSAAPMLALRAEVGRAVLVAVLAAAIVGAVGATLVARSTTRPLRRLAAAVSGIDAASLDHRIAPPARDRELVALTDAFNALLARLEAAFERQRAFVARASHALRTPAATILTRAEVTLARPRSGEAYRSALEEIAEASRESAALVEHLLSLARLEERSTEVRLEPVDPVGLARELERLLGQRAAAAGVHLSFDVDEGTRIVADRAALREMLEALLDNALRYTPRGGRAGLRVDGQTLVVWDTGPGMSAAEKARAFERFFRGQAAERSGAPGSGLGLAIARAVVERHGGTIALEDRAGGGLEVIVRWPGAPSAGSQAGTRVTGRSGSRR